MKRGHGEKYSRQKEAAILALLTAPTIDAAAQLAKVSSPTLWRWLQERDFQDSYRKARREALSQATARLSRASSLAVTALEDIVKDLKAPAAARLTAARTILELGFKSFEIDDIERRLASLEASREVTN